MGQLVFALNEKFAEQFSAIAADNDCKPVIKAGQTFYVDTRQDPEPETLALLVIAEEDRAIGIVRYYVGPTKTGHKTRATSPQRDETYAKRRSSRFQNYRHRFLNIPIRHITLY